MATMAEQTPAPGVASRGDNLAKAAVNGHQFRRLLPADVAAEQRKRWERTPDKVWFSPRTPLPPEVPRGPYARPTRALVRSVAIGLRRLTGEQ
ncbi:hypothetical protein GCM10009753_71300 [Streptantibioticus ferralitis]